MITSFRHKGLRRFYETGNAAGVQASHKKRLRFQLAALDTAARIEDMDIPGFRLHPLKGDRTGNGGSAFSGITSSRGAIPTGVVIFKSGIAYYNNPGMHHP